jgi:hypothetical protein
MWNSCQEQLEMDSETRRFETEFGIIVWPCSLLSPVAYVNEQKAVSVTVHIITL